MNEAKPYVTRREAVRVLGLVTASVAAGVAGAPGRAEAASRYKIIYKLNHGKNKSGQVKYLDKGASKKVSKLKKPKRTGYKFKGWYLDKKFKTKAKRVYGKASKSKRTVYAKWTPVWYKIVYKLNGGRQIDGLALRSSRTVESTTVNLLAPARSGYTFMGWYSDKKLKKRVTDIPKKTVGKVTLYAKWKSASYWNAHIDEKRAQIRDVLAKVDPDASDTFLFITDMHLHSNTMCSPMLVDRVMDLIPTKMTVFGGDAIGLSSTKTEACHILRYVHNTLDYGNLLFLRGNHDNNNQNSNYAPITLAQYSAEAHVDPLPDAGDAVCFYKDVEDKKIRYIALDTGEPSEKMSDTQVEWLQGRILDLPEGWTVVVFQHEFFQVLRGTDRPSQPRIHSNGRLTIRALNAVFEEAQAKGITIAGVISGHGHYDHAEQPSTRYPLNGETRKFPYWGIITTCDACDCSPPLDPFRTQRKRGTIGEQAFDVVTIDTKEKKIYMTRVGGGENREFYYGSESE